MSSKDAFQALLGTFIGTTVAKKAIPSEFLGMLSGSKPPSPQISKLAGMINERLVDDTTASVVKQGILALLETQNISEPKLHDLLSKYGSMVNIEVPDEGDVVLSALIQISERLATRSEGSLGEIVGIVNCPSCGYNSIVRT